MKGIEIHRFRRKAEEVLGFSLTETEIASLVAKYFNQGNLKIALSHLLVISVQTDVKEVDFHRFHHDLINGLILSEKMKSQHAPSSNSFYKLGHEEVLQLLRDKITSRTGKRILFSYFAMYYLYPALYLGSSVVDNRIQKGDRLFKSKSLLLTYIFCFSFLLAIRTKK